MKNIIVIVTIFFCVVFSHIVIAQKPEPRWTHGICYDTNNKTVLIFGGSGTNGFFGDLWSFSNGTWKKLADSGPPARFKFAFAYDEKRKRAVLFGGSGPNDELFSDTWEWDGRAWTRIDAIGPAKRNHPMAGYDPQSQTIIIKGGFNESGLLTDTWSFDGTKWIQLTHEGSAGNGLAHGMFVDESTKRLTLITAEMGDRNQQQIRNTWWTLNKNKWEQGKEFPSTSKQSIQAITSYGNGGIIYFDGDDIKDNNPLTAWLSKGKWEKQNFSGPAPRIGHAMVWDPVRKVVFLFGGFDRKDFFNDTWIWENEKWVEQR